MLVEFDFRGEGLCVLHLKGRFLTGADAEYLRTKIEELKATGCKRAVVDFLDVPYLDSTGIGFVVSCYTTLTRDGGLLVLTNMNRRVRQVLEITRLTGIIPTCEDLESAITVLAASARGEAAGA